MSNDSISSDTEKFTRNKHTFRRCYYNYTFDKETSISSKRSTPMTASGTPNEIPVTEIDSYFPEAAFVFKHQRMDGVLNTVDRWDNLINDLEEKAITKTSSYCRWKQLTLVTYSVSVIGHIVTSNDNEAYKHGTKNIDVAIQHPEWLCWNGFYYNPDNLYELIRKENLLDYKFKFAGPRIMPLPVFDDSSIKKLRFQLSRRCKSSAAINHDSYTTSGSGWKQITGSGHNYRHQKLQPASKYLEIDMRCEQHVTHIGIAGQFPKCMTFPSTEAVKEFCPDELEVLNEFYHKRHSRRRKRHVQIIAPDYIPAYVTAYTVHYFHPKLKTWLRISDVFTGNTNCVDEVVHDLRPGTSANGIYARYFRFEPVSYQTLPIMRVAVYGHDMNKKMQSSGDANIKEVETVKYTVTPGRPNRCGLKMKLNKSSSYYDDWNDNIITRMAKMRHVQDIIRQDEIDIDDTGDSYFDGEKETILDEANPSARKTLTMLDFCSHLFPEEEAEYDSNVNPSESASISTDGSRLDDFMDESSLNSDADSTSIQYLSDTDDEYILVK